MEQGTGATEDEVARSTETVTTEATIFTMRNTVAKELDELPECSLTQYCRQQNKPTKNRVPTTMTIACCRAKSKTFLIMSQVKDMLMTAKLMTVRSLF
jgi:hypothetical protein